MDYKRTLKNFSATLSKSHLAKYKNGKKIEIIYLTLYIYTKAITTGVYKFIFNISTPKNLYENESSYYKAWVCYIVAKEINKR